MCCCYQKRRRTTTMKNALISTAILCTAVYIGMHSRMNKAEEPIPTPELPQVEIMAKRRANGEGLDISRADQFTLSEWLRHWLNNYGKVYLRPSSFTNYTRFLNNQIKNDPIATIKLNKLTTNDLQQFYNRMSESAEYKEKNRRTSQKACLPNLYAIFTASFPTL